MPHKPSKKRRSSAHPHTAPKAEGTAATTKTAPTDTARQASPATEDITFPAETIPQFARSDGSIIHIPMLVLERIVGYLDFKNVVIFRSANTFTRHLSHAVFYRTIVKKGKAWRMLDSLMGTPGAVASTQVCHLVHWGPFVPPSRDCLKLLQGVQTVTLRNIGRTLPDARHFPHKIDRLVVEMPAQDRTLPFRWSDSSMRFSASSRPIPSICTESFVLILKRPDLMDCGVWDSLAYTLLHYAKTKHLTIVFLSRGSNEFPSIHCRWIQVSSSWVFPDLEHLTIVIPDTARRFEGYSSHTKCTTSRVSLKDYLESSDSTGVFTKTDEAVLRLEAGLA